MFKLFVLAILAAIVLSLGSGLFFLLRDGSDSRRMVNALTVRVGLSVALFILLFVAWGAGLIRPHGVLPG